MASATARTWQTSQDRMHPHIPTAARRLSPQQIDEIREQLADGARPQELAVVYGVSAGAIRRYQ